MYVSEDIQTHLSHLGVRGVCLGVECGAVAVAQSESLELLLWLFLDRRNPALFSWGGNCVRGQRGKCLMDKCGSPQSGCCSVLLFSQPGGDELSVSSALSSSQT